MAYLGRRVSALALCSPEGWSWECLDDWGSYIRLAIPSMIMLCAEWWTYEIGCFLAGLISEVELGAQSVIYQLAVICLLFPLGISLAGSVRVGNALGAGDTDQAKLSAKLTMFCAGAVSVCFSVLVGILKDHISYVFTYDEQIRVMVARIMAFYSPLLLLDALSAASSSVIRGLGKQKVGAICNILGYYGVCLPIGIPLMFAGKLGIMGFWIGVLSCVSLQCLFFIVYLLKMNWMKATEEAQIRAGVQSNYIDMDASSPYEEHIEQRPGQDNDGAEVAGVTSEGMKVPLDHRTLLMWKGLALCVMLVILALGVVINLRLTNLT
ncbi:hypothetical protein UPYG_G00200480 [Umbra pygmaea]|uniref:Multidrug and toxin extrusion protein 1 n=1 Tax=Umbra pygmaea TaxID=75934 RepID=A0ABD0WMW7_UMBPY